MAKQVILIVSGTPQSQSQALRNTCTNLRSQSSATVSGYYGDDVSRLRVDDIKDITTGFMLIGLSPQSRDKETDCFKVERAMLQHALLYKIPVGIVCDEFDGITAPYIHGDMIDLVRLVVVRKPNEGCSPKEIYSKSHVVTGEPLQHTDEITATILDLMPSLAKPLSESVPRQQAAAQPSGGWANQQMTD